MGELSQFVRRRQARTFGYNDRAPPRSRKESIVINGDITITVVEVRGDKVRLGFTAPKEVPINREEVFKDSLASRRRPDAGGRGILQVDALPDRTSGLPRKDEPHA